MQTYVGDRNKKPTVLTTMCNTVYLTIFLVRRCVFESYNCISEPVGFRVILGLVNYTVRMV